MKRPALKASTLPVHELDALASGTHHDPFAVLGAHTHGPGKYVIRCLVPGAQSIVLLAANGATLADCALVHSGGIFEALLTSESRPDYRLLLNFPQQTVTVADAYAFGCGFSEAEIDDLASGRRARAFELLGAHRVQMQSGAERVHGTRFALWAPNAKRVSVVGDFNGWDGRRHAMRMLHRAGVWEIFIPHVGVGDCYKFELLDRNGHLLPLKADPYARAAELRPQTASKVVDLLPKAAGLSKREALNQREAPISVYEVHAGSWRSRDNGEFLNWRELAEVLPTYAKDMGFTHIELMPISEFPFDGSWGYQTLGMFAPSARFGTQEDFAHFVARCHALELGVIVDWVPAHFPTDAHGLSNFDGTALYEYADPREGFHKDWNTAIYNFGRNEVRQFLVASALYWIERFNVDGLRVDAVASMLYRDYSRNAGEWIPNQFGGRENLEAISLFKAINECLGNELPGCLTVAEESTAFPGVSRPTYAGGLGFHYKWNMGWMNDTLRYIAEDPIHRKYHHDLLTFGLVYGFSENYMLPISHDEVVHGKGSLWQKMPGDEWQKFANVRAYLSFMWAHPGKKLLFMGQEFAQREEWNYQQGLPWYITDYPEHAGVQNMVRDLNRHYRNERALHQLDCEPTGFQWLALNDRDTSVLAFARFDRDGNCIIAVFNFTPVVRENYRIALPDSVGALEEIFNSDSSHYGGSNVGNGMQHRHAENVAHQGSARSACVNIGPLAAMYFRAHRQ
jgi:1,4-alpha-glucan branching enzyme